MTDQELIQFWEGGTLVRWPPQAVDKLKLPDETKRILVKVGLPGEMDWTMRFDTAGGRLPELPERPGCFVIGRDDLVPFCIDRANGGRILSVDVDGTELFVNSSLRLFAEFLVLYQKYRLAVGQLDEQEALKLIADTERQMSKRDPPSLARPDCWWALIVEQMKDGLL